MYRRLRARIRGRKGRFPREEQAAIEAAKIGRAGVHLRRIPATSDHLYSDWLSCLIPERSDTTSTLM